MSALSSFTAVLPAPGVLRERLRVLAALEAAFGSRWARYAFDGIDESGFERFRFENGGGDDYHVFLGPSSAFLRAFDHESRMSPYTEHALRPGRSTGFRRTSCRSPGFRREVLAKRAPTTVVIRDFVMRFGHSEEGK
ncbi:hypothetical protein ACIA9I_34635 [Streptomyces anulatus]